MVKLAVSVAFSAVLFGCLSKPDFTGGNTIIDCSKHAGQIPYNLVLSGPPRVGELDGNAGDDLVLFGNVVDENNQPTASGAWLVYGGADMSASCYDQALFLFDSQIEDPKTTTVIDVTLADMNSDGKDDVLLESRDGDNYYAGAALSGPSGIGDKVVTIPASRQVYTSAWGDTSPAFVAACPTAVAFGGNTGPFASAYLAGTGDLTILKPMGADTTTALTFTEPVEYMWRDIGGHDLLVGGVHELHAIQCPSGTNDTEMYRPFRPYVAAGPSFDAASFNDSGPRAVNPYHRALGGRTLATSISEETPQDHSWDVVSYSPTDGFSVYLLDNIDRVETDGATRMHESLGQTVATGQAYDLIALMNDGNPRLRIFPSLTPYNTSTLQSANPIDGKVGPDAKYVAVGNWTGTTAHDSIFVIDRETTDTFGACYEPIAAGCIVPCGQTTCM